MNKVLITGSYCPDMDAVSCAITYAAYLQAKDPSKMYQAKFDGGVHMEPGFVCEQLGFDADILDKNDKFDAYILVDASELKGLPKIICANDVVEVIDHRLFAEYESFPNAKFRVEPVGAAATQIAEFFYFDTAVPLSSTHAALLLCGICSNTINFQSDTTTFRDQRIRTWLYQQLSPQLQMLPQRMYDFKSNYALNHVQEVLRDDAKDNCDFGLEEAVVIFQIETLQTAELIQRQEELLTHMHALFPQRKHLLLLIQDAKNGRTIMITDSKSVVTILQKTHLPIEDTESKQRLELPQIVMRKSVYQAVLSVK
jgi:manganese-dependent inorganic pyrophosphatase